MIQVVLVLRPYRKAPPPPLRGTVIKQGWQGIIAGTSCQSSVNHPDYTYWHPPVKHPHAKDKLVG